MSKKNENQVTPKVIVEAFSFLGGDYKQAIKNAKDYSSVNEWIWWQAGYTGAVGAGALLIPGAHVPLIVVDVAFLLHKMAYCCWGIGALHGCEIEAKEDFSVILGMYAGVIKEDSINAAVGTGALAATGHVIVSGGLPKFLGKGTGMAIKSAGKAMLKGAAATGKKVAIKSIAGSAMYVSGPLIGHISGKVATKVGAKMGMKGVIKTVTSGLTGFIPVIGSGLGAAINMYFVKSISSKAEEYYAIKKAHA